MIKKPPVGGYRFPTHHLMRLYGFSVETVRSPCKRRLDGCRCKVFNAFAFKVLILRVEIFELRRIA